MSGAVAAAGQPVSAGFGAARTVSEIASRIRRHYGAGWQDDAGDVLVIGDLRTRVSGIAVTAMPDMVTLQRAVAAGCNMIVSTELPLYARSGIEAADQALHRDPTYVDKLAYISDHKLAFFHLAANLRVERSEPLIEAIGTVLGWPRSRGAAEQGIYTLPRTTLGALARRVKRRLGVNGGMRVIGRAEMPLARVLVAPGRIDPVATVKLLPSVDVLLAGDLREWELVEYIADSWQTAAPKALIAVGRILSEQPGLLATVAWLRAVSGVPVVPLSVEDPFWRLPA